MATIEDLNKAYTKEDSILKKLTAPGGLKDKIVQLELELSSKVRDFKVKEAELQYAEARNDKATANTLRKDLEALSKDIIALRNKLEKARDFLTAQQKTVDEKFAELSKNPEIKKKLDTILYKKYDRKKQQELNKKQQLEKIKQVVDAHPTVQTWLKGIEGYEKSIRKCDKIIDKYTANPPTTPKEQQEFADAQTEKAKSEQSLANRRSDLVSYFAKNHPEIDKDILENIHSYSNIDRQIAGCDKSINNYDKAMNSLAVAKGPNTAQQTSPTSLAPAPAQKPSWFRHPIQRLKYSINSKKAKSSQPQPPTSNKSRYSFLDKVKLSKDEYNAEIVQKYLNEQYKEGLHNAARQKDTDPNVR